MNMVINNSLVQFKLAILIATITYKEGFVW